MRASWRWPSTSRAANGATGTRRWPGASRRRCARLDSAHAERIAFWKFCQWCFFRQWQRLKDYAHRRGVEIVGDAPIFIALHSAEVWARPDLFELDPTGGPRWWPACRPICSAPPASAGATRCTAGARMRRRATPGGSSASGAPSSWWTSCASITFAASRPTGRSRPASPRPSTAAGCNGPGEALFNAIGKALGPLPIIAEDLGVITPDVVRLRKALGLPGMRILQFALGRVDGARRPASPAAQLRARHRGLSPARTTTTPRSAGGTRRRSTCAITCATTSPATASTSPGI